jgi:hypothetical protein
MNRQNNNNNNNNLLHRHCHGVVRLHVGSCLCNAIINIFLITENMN